MGDGRWGEPYTGGGRLNTQKRAERGHIGIKERGDGQDVCLEQGARMNLGGGGEEGTTTSSKGTHRNLTLRGQSLEVTLAYALGWNYTTQ